MTISSNKLMTKTQEVPSAASSVPAGQLACSCASEYFVIANIAANPIQQTVKLKKPVKARYFKFVALHSANGIPLSAAELGVITK